MSRMLNGRGETREQAQPTELRSKRKRSAMTATPEQFERAFADALRDILRDEIRLAS